MRKYFLCFLLAANNAFAQFSTFTPHVYRPTRQDYSTLQRSLEQIERRQNEANEQYSKLQMMLAEYGNQLNNDEATLIWFDEYKKRIERTFDSLSGLGWDEARDYAIRKQGEIINDPELNARKRTSIEYAAKIRSIEERTDIDWKQKSEWKENNPYCFVAIKNADGKIIGGRLGSKVELEEQKLEAERIRRAEEERVRQLEALERSRRYNMEHPFDNFDYSKYETIVAYPPCKKCPDGMKVTKVAMSSSETRIEFELISTYQWCSISRDTYIKAKGKDNLKLVKADNIAYSPSSTIFKQYGEKLVFALTFPPLPPKAKSISIIEPVKNGYIFKGIKIK